MLAGELRSTAGRHSQVPARSPLRTTARMAAKVNGEERAHGEAAGRAAELESSHVKERMTSTGLCTWMCLRYSVEQRLLI